MLALLAVITMAFPGCGWFSQEGKDQGSPSSATVVEKDMPTEVEDTQDTVSEPIENIQEPEEFVQDDAPDTSSDEPVAVEQQQEEKEESLLERLARDPRVKRAYTTWKKAVEAEASIYESPEYKAFSDVQMRLVQDSTNDERVQSSIKHIEEVQNQVMKDLGLEDVQQRLKEIGDPIKEKYDLEEKQLAYQNAGDDEREMRQVDFLNALSSTMQELNENSEFRDLSTKAQEVMSQAPEDTRLADAMSEYGKKLESVMQEGGSEQLQEKIRDYVEKKRKKINVEGALARLKKSLGPNVSEEQFYNIISTFEQSQNKK